MRVAIPTGTTISMPQVNKWFYTIFFLFILLCWYCDILPSYTLITLVLCIACHPSLSTTKPKIRQVVNKKKRTTNMRNTALLASGYRINFKAEFLLSRGFLKLQEWLLKSIESADTKRDKIKAVYEFGFRPKQKTNGRKVWTTQKHHQLQSVVVESYKIWKNK